MMRVSVIIPAYNAGGLLPGLFESLLILKVPDGMRVGFVLVDDGSTDSTRAVAEAAVPRFDGRLTVISTENAGPAAARNRGAEASDGDLLLFTDADCHPQEDWLLRMTAPFLEDPELGAAKGVYSTRQRGITPRFVQLEYEYRYRRMARYEMIDFIDTYSAAFRRDVFLSHGGFDTGFPDACAEDAEFSYRLASAGVKMCFVPDAVVIHRHPRSPLVYCRRKWKYAYWRMAALERHPGFMKKDSHTPQLLKFQILFLFPALASSGLLPLFPGFWPLPLSFFGLYILACLPFLGFLLLRSVIVGAFGIPLLLLRTLGQGTGILARILYRLVHRQGSAGL